VELLTQILPLQLQWINNCVGKRNYKAFIALVVMCLLMLVLQWVTGIVVLERYFSNKKSFDKEIVEKLGISFTPVAFAVVVVCEMSSWDTLFHCS
jgi:alpha-N-acetylglucosamine transferase